MNILDPIFYRTLFYDFHPVISPGFEMLKMFMIGAFTLVLVRVRGFNTRGRGRPFKLG